MTQKRFFVVPKRILALFLAVFMAVICLSTRAYASSWSPTDVNSGTLYQREILYVCNYHGFDHLLDTKKQVKPDQVINHSELQGMLANMWPGKAPSVGAADYTTDPVDQAWLCGKLSNLAAALGTACSWSGGEPTAQVSRGLAAAMVVRFVECYPKGYTPTAVSYTKNSCTTPTIGEPPIKSSLKPWAPSDIDPKTKNANEILIVADYHGFDSLINQQNQVLPDQKITRYELQLMLNSLWPGKVPSSDQDNATIATQKWLTDKLSGTGANIGTPCDWSGGSPAAELTRRDACCIIVSFINSMPGVYTPKAKYY